jgi:hypothetical protein
MISGLSTGFSQLLVADVDMLSCGGGFSGNWSQVDGRLTIWRSLPMSAIELLHHHSQKIIREYESDYALVSIIAPIPQPIASLIPPICTLSSSIILCSAWDIIISLYYGIETIYYAIKVVARVYGWTIRLYLA